MRPKVAGPDTPLRCRSWRTEAILRMLENNLHNAEDPDALVVYGGTGKAARDWRSFDAMVRTLKTLKQDETMLVQSGRPVGVMQTHEWAPRVLIANSNLVGDWANWEEFRRLEALGLTMYGQMTAGSWIYIGTQGILQGTYETFAAVAAKKFNGTLAGTITLTAGLGGMGGAQPLAVTMNDGVAICIDVDPRAIERRIEHKYLDVKADSLEHALQLAVEARDARRPLSIGLLGNAADLLPRMLAEGAPVDIVTDQTSAHDPLAYLPSGVDFDDMATAAEKDPAGFTQRARESMAKHVEAMVGFMDAGAEVFDYGNSIRGEAQLAGYDRAFAFPGFVPAYIRPLFCEGKGPFRWAALSGEASDIHKTDKAILDLFPADMHQAIRQTLAFNLKAIVAQKLLKGLKKPRVPTNEIMIVNPTIRDLILTGERVGEINDQIAGGREEYGSQTFDQHLADLVLHAAPDPRQVDRQHPVPHLARHLSRRRRLDRLQRPHPRWRVQPGVHTGLRTKPAARPRAVRARSHRHRAAGPPQPGGDPEAQGRGLEPRRVGRRPLLPRHRVFRRLRRPGDQIEAGGGLRPQAGRARPRAGRCPGSRPRRGRTGSGPRGPRARTGAGGTRPGTRSSARSGAPALRPRCRSAPGAGLRPGPREPHPGRSRSTRLL